MEAMENKRNYYDKEFTQETKIVIDEVCHGEKEKKETKETSPKSY